MRRLADGVARHWLLAVNAAAAAFLAGAVLAPLLAQAGAAGAADVLYAAYHAACHQWAFRSFFVFGEQAVYGREQLAALGVDAFGTHGGPGLGWKVALCERDLAVYAGLLGFGLLFARRRGSRPAGWLTYALLALPMALDGLTQLPGWRESTWTLRLATGLLFGAASGWLLYPRFEAALRPAAEADARRYPPRNPCAQPSPHG